MTFVESFKKIDRLCLNHARLVTTALHPEASETLLICLENKDLAPLQEQESGDMRSKANWLGQLRTSLDFSTAHATALLGYFSDSRNSRTWEELTNTDWVIGVGYLQVLNIATKHLGENAFTQKAQALKKPGVPPSASIKAGFEKRSGEISTTIDAAVTTIESRMATCPNLNTIENQNLILTLRTFQEHINAKNHIDRKATFSKFCRVRANTFGQLILGIDLLHPDGANPNVMSTFIDDNMSEAIFWAQTPEDKATQAQLENLKPYLRTYGAGLKNSLNRLQRLSTQTIFENPGYGFIGQTSGVSIERISVLNKNRIDQKLEQNALKWLSHFSLNFVFDPKSLDLANVVLYSGHELGHPDWKEVEDRWSQIKRIAANEPNFKSGVLLKAADGTLEEILVDAFSLVPGSFFLADQGMTFPTEHIIMAKLLGSLGYLTTESKNKDNYGNIYRQAECYVWTNLKKQGLIQISNGCVHIRNWSGIMEFFDATCRDFALRFMSSKMPDSELRQKLFDFSIELDETSTYFEKNIAPELSI